MVRSHETIWNECLAIIKDNVSPEAFSSWFAPIIPLSHANKELTIQVPSSFFFEYLEENYLSLLSEAIFKVAGENTRLMYSVIVENQDKSAMKIEGSPTPYRKDKQPNKSLQASIDPFHRQVVADLNPQLNQSYSFSNFIEGVSNKLARSAGETVAVRPGKNPFNPLFVYGSSGVGKTHLLHAIGSTIKMNDPQSRVLYVSTHLFQVQFTDSILNNKVNDFINFYQSIDVLLIDDIQELIGKERTQTTFFNIFNHLHQTGKQLVISCDKAPVELQGMSERLLTRFKWGLSAELEAPDFTLRKSILQSKIRHDGLIIPEDVVDFIAARVNASARDLEGIIVSLLAHSTIYNKDIDMAMAERVLAKCVKNIRKEITLDLIQNTVCNFYNVDLKVLHSRTRKREIVNARQISMYLSKKLTDFSFSRIGEMIGKKDHATVVHACNVIRDQIAIDKNLDSEIKEIEGMIRH